MKQYVCPEGDTAQTTPGICPNHGLDLEEKEMGEEMGEESIREGGEHKEGEEMGEKGMEEEGDE